MTAIKSLVESLTVNQWIALSIIASVISFLLLKYFVKSSMGKLVLWLGNAIIVASTTCSILFLFGEMELRLQNEAGLPAGCGTLKPGIYQAASDIVNSNAVLVDMTGTNGTRLIGPLPDNSIMLGRYYSVTIITNSITTVSNVVSIVPTNRPEGIDAALFMAPGLSIPARRLPEGDYIAKTVENNTNHVLLVGRYDSEIAYAVKQFLQEQTNDGNLSLKPFFVNEKIYNATAFSDGSLNIREVRLQ